MAAGIRGRRGGIRGLHRLVTEHGEAIEADLQRVFGIDLLDLYRGRLTWRRLGVLVRSLARRPDSDLYRAIGGEAAEWTLDQHLAASLVDRLTLQNYLAALSLADPKKRRSIPKPVFLDRPGAPAQQPRGAGVIRFGGRHGSRELQHT